MNKIEPIRLAFENMQALLARIAEDEDVIGFAGVIFRKNDTAHVVTFDCTRKDVAFASVMLQANSLESIE